MGKKRPLGSFSSCPRIPQSGQGGRAALWAALRADPGHPSARLGRPFGPPFGPPFFLKGGPRRPGRPGGPQGGPQALRAAPSDARREARCSWVNGHGVQQGGAVGQRSARVRRSVVCQAGGRRRWRRAR
eukprot:scaffold47052_cov49-Phaeocystis_antarctica.AAC.1